MKTHILTEPDFIYCLLSKNGPPMKDMLPIFHHPGDCFYFNSVKYQVLEIQIADENDLEEIGWDDYQLANPPLIIYAEECGRIDYNQLKRDLKLKNIIENDDH